MIKLVPIIMGSDKDIDFAQKMLPVLKKFEIDYDIRVASAHKHPEYVLRVVKEYDSLPDTSIVYVAIAGRQNALGNTIAGNTTNLPVIACYPDAKADADILSSLHSPGGVTIYPVLDPNNVGIAVAGIMARTDPDMKYKVEQHHKKMKSTIESADAGMRRLDNVYDDIFTKLSEGVAGHPVNGIVLIGKHADIHEKYFRGVLKDAAEYLSMPPLSFDDVMTKIKEPKDKGIKFVVSDSTQDRNITHWPEDFYMYNLDAMSEMRRK